MRRYQAFPVRPVSLLGCSYSIFDVNLIITVLVQITNVAGVIWDRKIYFLSMFFLFLCKYRNLFQTIINFHTTRPPSSSRISPPPDLSLAILLLAVFSDTPISRAISGIVTVWSCLIQSKTLSVVGSSVSLQILMPMLLLSFLLETE